MTKLSTKRQVLPVTANNNKKAASNQPSGPSLGWKLIWERLKGGDSLENPEWKWETVTWRLFFSSPQLVFDLNDGNKKSTCWLLSKFWHDVLRRIRPLCHPSRRAGGSSSRGTPHVPTIPTPWSLRRTQKGRRAVWSRRGAIKSPHYNTMSLEWVCVCVCLFTGASPLNQPCKDGPQCDKKNIYI